MKKECYTQVAFIVLRRKKGEPLINVPLYVKFNEVGSSGVPEEQEEMIHKISGAMNKRYENQIRQYFASLKQEQTNTASVPFEALPPP